MTCIWIIAYFVQNITTIEYYYFIVEWYALLYLTMSRNAYAYFQPSPPPFPDPLAWPGTLCFNIRIERIVNFDIMTNSLLYQWYQTEGRRMSKENTWDLIMKSVLLMELYRKFMFSKDCIYFLLSNAVNYSETFKKTFDT